MNPKETPNPSHWSHLVGRTPSQPRPNKIFRAEIAVKTSRPWEVQLFEEIPKREKFYLFWSKEAAESEWVEKEWRCALETRGLDNIQPMPLDDPRIAPPPPELGATLHFYDPMLAQIAYEKMINKQLGRSG